MRKIAITLACMFGCITPAMAQEAASVDRWDGPYIGVNLGNTWLAGDMNASTPYNSYNGFAVSSLNDGSLAGGVQLGFNKQFGAIGLGGEATATFSGNKKESTDNTAGTLFWRNSKFNATVGPRLAFSTPAFQLSAKGGLAIGKFEVGHNQNGTLISADKTLYGYMLGAGAELAIGPKLSVGLGYEYLDFGKAEIHVVSPNSDIFLQPGSKTHNVKAVVNYRF